MALLISVALAFLIVSMIYFVSAYVTFRDMKPLFRDLIVLTLAGFSPYYEKRTREVFDRLWDKTHPKG